MPGARILVIDDSPTILKVVGSILARSGYEALTARDGASALEMLNGAGPKPDLVLLDFVMPRMNGYQFCRELRSGPHRELPVVLMSAKSDKIRGQFVQQMGAVDAISKPFDPRALLAMLEGALAKAAEGRSRAVPSGSAMPDEDSLVESARSSSARSMPPSLPSRQRAHHELVRRLVLALRPGLRASGLTEPSPETLDDVVEAALTAELIAELAPLVRTTQSASEPGHVLSGDMAAVPLAEVLQMLQMQRQTGVMRIVSGRNSCTLYIKDGSIDLVTSQNTSDEFRIGRYFLERGLLTRAQLDQATGRKPAGKLLGEFLVDDSVVRAEDLHDALARQSSELVYELVRWPSGRFTFVREPFPEEAKRAALQLGMSGLVLEGYRRVDEWRLMEGTIQFDQVVVVDALALDTVDDKLTKRDRVVLGAIDGERTVSQVIGATHLASFDVVKVLYQLLKSRLVRVRQAA